TIDGTTKGRKGWRDSRNPCSAIRTGSPPVIRALVAQCDVNLASAPPDNNRDRSGTQGFYGRISTGEAIRVGESGAIAGRPQARAARRDPRRGAPTPRPCQRARY